MSELRKLLEAALATANAAVAERNHLEVVNAELLEALKEILASGEIPFCESSPLVIKAKLAISKALGEPS